MESLTDIEVTPAQADAFARGLFAVARADGTVHPEEAALVKSFYGETTGGRVVDVAALERAPDLAPTALAAALGAGPLGPLFIKSCLLLAYADGTCSAKERDVVAAYARALGIADPDVARSEQEVKEYLLSHVSGLSNSAAVAGVARNLKL